MDIEIGRKIKELRSFYRISQADLCEGICNQSFISKLEKGLVHPSANVLSMIAERLGVAPQYFFDPFADVTKVNYMYKVIDSISKNIDRAKYAEVLEMVEAEEENPIFKRADLKQYLLWRKGICLFHLEEDAASAVDCLDEALALAPTTAKNKSERELDILLSKAIIYSVMERYQEAASIYKLLLKEIARHPYVLSNKLLLRTYYNYSKNEFDQENYKTSLKFSQEGVKYCLQNDSLYILGEFYFQCGQSGWKGGQLSKKEALRFYERAKTLFLLRNNTFFAEIVDEEIEELTVENI
ncbi:helix-turn-helix domain-containing protein [Alkalicoccus daliensis]|uniref:Helix-turn-helix domain-containing protein n=1 Tax=Alkalicoccus daliensis TaxID=745820 RepID=A0A1H0E0N1_9BACI|nr:helix-turn-helix domain-containing protein [Alkalicoccus daliensis]SDN75952.1 Helix-turn-helix domain-containing protein [Alkalicoccus daliensis]